MSSGRRMIVCVAVLAAAVRLPGVFSQSLWEDEVASARIITEPTFPRMLAHVARTESTPPLWYAIGWVVHQAGAPVVDVRLVSVAAGAVLAGLVVDLARRVVGPPFAALAGFLAATGSQLVGHGHELRSYELLALLAAGLARVLVAELDAPSRRLDVTVAAVVAAGALTHYFFLFSAATALAWLWLDPAARRIRRRASAAVAGGLVVAASWTPVLLRQYGNDRFWWIGGFRLRNVVAAPTRLFTPLYANTPVGALVAALGLLIVAVGCAHLARTSARGRLLAALAFGPLVEAASLWASGVRIYALRNLIEIAPFVAVAAAAAVAGVAAQRVPRYDVIARTLVAEGWTPSMPVAIFGDFFRYRAPLEWYLPRRPVLDAARPRAGVCQTVFVIRGRHVRRLTLARPLETARALRGATILADPSASPACVRPITRGRLAALS